MTSGPIAAQLAALRSGQETPALAAERALARANGNARRNTYIALDPEWTLREAARQSRRAASGESLPLFGLPVSLKDCFDLAGFPTSSGVRFCAERDGIHAADSWVAARLRHAGAVIIGKTHLHPLAYGITGENPDYGDCLQPANPALLTGGSSSGAAASVQEGSALAAIGTDTGGSVRVPAALCGLAGYRASLGCGGWAGGHHLAPSFDTLGWLFRDLRDAALLAESLFDLPPAPPERRPVSIGILSGVILHDCDAPVLRALSAWQDRLRRAGAHLAPIEPPFWLEAWDIYAPIQAAEAAQLHAGFFSRFPPALAARLEWGASLPAEELREHRQRHRSYRERLAPLFRQFDFLLAPATPVSALPAGADHADARARILRHTTPASLGGLPAVVLPSSDCGVQLMAAHNDDRRLLRFAAQLAEAQQP